jgi:hypothetical protein
MLFLEIDNEKFQNDSKKTKKKKKKMKNHKNLSNRINFRPH